MASPTLVIEIAGKSKGFRKALDSSSGALTSWGGKVGKITANATKAFAAFSAGAGIALLAIGKKGVDNAADLNETVSKTEAILGNAAGTVLKFSESTSRAFGISQTAALDMASQYAGALKNIGKLTVEEAAEVSKGLVGLTADLGSFFNASNEDVQAAIGSALTGEFEPLKKFNIIINESILKQKALELGVYDGVGALDAETKQMATLAIITEQTADAQGDFAKTSGGLANSRKRFTAIYEEMTVKIGQKLLPVVNRLLNFFIENMPQMERIAGRVFGRIGEIAERLAPVFERAILFIVDNIPLIVATISFMVERVRERIEVLASVILPVLGDIVAFVMENWPLIASTVETAMLLIQEIIVAVSELVLAIWERWGDEILLVVKTLVVIMVPIIEGMAKVVLGIIKTLTSLVKGDWSEAWENIKRTLSGAVGLIKAIVSGLWTALKLAFRLGVEALVTLFARAWVSIVDTLKKQPGNISSAAKGLFDGIKDAFKSAINYIIRKWNGLEFGLPSFDTKIPGVGSVGGFTVGTPNIPLLAKGGALFGPTLFGGGEYPGARSNPEIVSPVSIMADTFRSVLKEMGGNGPGINVEHVTVLDGRDFFETIERKVALA